MPFTLIREYVEYEHSWWRFCGVYETREEADKAIAIIKGVEYDRPKEAVHADFFTYDSDVNELVYMTREKMLEPNWWLENRRRVFRT
jgi:hypothetical protein